MSRYVLDSSAVLIALHKGPGGDRVLACLGESTISAVNFAEVVAKLGRTGGDITQVLSDLRELLPDIRPFDADQALATGFLDTRTTGPGLSTGDRACLGLAKALGVPVMTADPSWAKLNVGVGVEVISGMTRPLSEALTGNFAAARLAEPELES